MRRIPFGDTFQFSGRTFGLNIAECADQVVCFYLEEWVEEQWQPHPVYFAGHGTIDSLQSFAQEAAIRWLQDRENGLPWPPVLETRWRETPAAEGEQPR